MKAREGDLIKTKSSVLFDVKGTTHPPERLVAFPRFIPDPQGPRKTAQGNYGKIYSLTDRFNYLKAHHPNLIIYDPVFGETLCEVPTDQIATHYQPTEKLAALRTAKVLSPLENKALRLATELKEAADIPWTAVGISGSIMAGLTTTASDIDPLVYGQENSHKAYQTLKTLRTNPDSGFKPYTETELKVLYDFRFKDTHMSFEDFQVVESRKAFQGMYQGVDYFVRFLKDWNETPEQYGDITYRNCGYIKIQAAVADDSDALFTPCTYGLEAVEVLEGPKLAPISEVSSFRGRFCMQAAVGEQIEAQGKIELITNKKSGQQYYRLILGNKPTDYMVLLR
jgi:predicted nucleotidyltransferase